jgi:hypothetical protein
MDGDKPQSITKRSRSREDKGKREAAPPKKVKRARKKLQQKRSETLPEDHNQRFQAEWPRFLNRHPELQKRIDAAVALENRNPSESRTAHPEDETEVLINGAVQEAIEEISLEKRLGIIEAPLVFPDRARPGKDCSRVYIWRHRFVMEFPWIEQFLEKSGSFG